MDDAHASTPVDDLRAAVLRAAAALGATPKSAPTLERPKQASHGDYATNAAMLLAGALKAPPRDVAARLADAIAVELGDDLDRAEIAGPGFLNLFLGDGWHARALTDVLAAGDDFGRVAPDAPGRERINVEFVSANPTGPVHVGGSRNAAHGDALARMLTFVGHDVHREYYVNDFGSQIVKLGESVQARARGEAIPEDGYQGAYVQEIADQLPGAADGDLAEVSQQAVALMIKRVKASLSAFGVEFDTWFSEKSLHEPGPDGAPSRVQHAFDVLAEQGRTYRHEGALWLRTTEFGDEKDRVLERSSGEHTYFASDIAYHQDKRERGYTRLIDLWGADHHGYMQRMHAAYEALGGAPGDLELLIMQFVHIVERAADEETGAEETTRVKMSKRAGEFVTLDELVSEIGVDAARWFLLARSHDTTMDLDLDLARSESAENPVYYVQYAHARIASILRRSEVTPDPVIPEGVALHASERALVQALLAFGPAVADAAGRRAPHRLVTYVLELAQTFTAFYRDCPIVGDEAEAFRAALAGATQHVLATGLDLLGISAPVEMHREDAAVPGPAAR
ncbi:arginine--tRNA ligase [Paraconexibacter antarcticus]|uniref:Arginine--tRNA ligase n=1 Tax=Paraconexibacter antarcticus TaxID=2949664 RepID=A0ABY5DX75_9ACTN|nr:arginine--tRNA ligase [Paraconexibacter antarcticus]UTI66633.1 arginine--tRNA ligase [Paraconexibacter antarcticus]